MKDKKPTYEIVEIIGEITGDTKVIIMNWNGGENKVAIRDVKDGVPYKSRDIHPQDIPKVIELLKEAIKRFPELYNENTLLPSINLMDYLKNVPKIVEQRSNGIITKNGSRTFLPKKAYYARLKELEKLRSR